MGGARGKGRPGLDSERSCAVSTCGRRQRATFHQRHRRLLHRTGPEPPIHQPAHHHHHHDNNNNNKLCTRPPQYAPAPCKLTFDLLTLKVVSEFTCDVGYLCANFSLPRPLCSRLRPDVRDIQTSDAHHRLMLPT